VVDTGVDCGHVELAGRCDNVFDAFAVNATAWVEHNDGHGHGTHCAGTVAGASMGISPGARVAGVRVLDDDGSGSTSSVLDGLDFILTQPRGAVVSMSIGGLCDDVTCDQDATIRAVDEYLVDAGFIVVVAAANDACDACAVSPAAARGAITVGATTINDARASYSNHGACVDLYAPGSDITSACARGPHALRDAVGCDDDRLTLSGTSMATPHVAGIVAQLLQMNKDLRAHQARALLQSTGTFLQHLDVDGGRPILARAPDLAPPTTWSDTDDGGYAARDGWICDKGRAGDACDATDHFLVDCDADTHDRLIAIAANWDDTRGWGDNQHFVVARYNDTDADSILLNGTLSCNYAVAVQTCVERTDATYIAAYCAHDDDDDDTERALYLQPCADYMTGAYPGEFFLIQTSSVDGACIAYSDFYRIDQYEHVARALCLQSDTQPDDATAARVSHDRTESVLLIAIPTAVLAVVFLVVGIERTLRRRYQHDPQTPLATQLKHDVTSTLQRARQRHTTLDE